MHPSQFLQKNIIHDTNLRKMNNHNLSICFRIDATLHFNHNDLISIMLRTFSRYVSVGMLNTLVHFSVFFAFKTLGSTQAIANIAGFAVAVTFSFFMNAKFTFKSKATKFKYCVFVSFMGTLAYFTGAIADTLDLPDIITLITFSGISLTFGYLYSKFFVFK